MNITIVDYGSGNISSVINSFKKASLNLKTNSKIKISSNSSEIFRSDKIILPGQGSFIGCMNGISKIDGLRDCLNQFVIKKKKPILGICVGMQMFADKSFEEIETDGFGWIPGKVKKIDNINNKYKLPHIGWNEIYKKNNSIILDGLEKNSHMYFVHSYEFIPTDKKHITSTTNYSTEIVCSIEKDNIFGTQFHPEKSQKNGLKLIENFINF